MTSVQPARFGQTLIARGLIDADQLTIALHEQRRDHQPLGRLLVRLGFIGEETLRDALSARDGQTPVSLASVTVTGDALALIPRHVAAGHRVLPLDIDHQRRVLRLAMADPQDVVALDRVRCCLAVPLGLDILLAGEADLIAAIDRLYGSTPLPDCTLVAEAGPGTGAGESAAVRLVTLLLEDAVRSGASDIHFEPEAGFLRIRQRIDGVLRQVRSLHQSYWPPMAVRIKVMAGLNIAENRTAQDGRVSFECNGRPLDLRISVQPTIHGENIVVRILDRHRNLLSLDALGLPPHHAEALRRLTACPEGLILVTGPTGSGKTTTLYAMLAQINDEARCIMTLEDPVEYPMAMIRQTAIGESSRLDFANGIRSMMRQDPDALLVGEIRDADTARMAMRAAMTGHQVYSTLHARSALGAIPRLLDLGIPPAILAGNLVGIVAQRLVRRLCRHCRQPRAATGSECSVLCCPADTQVFTAGACPHCGHSGYRGRLALMEVIRVTPELDALIAAGATIGVLAAQAASQGSLSLADDGRHHVLAGATSCAELARVIELGNRS